MRKNRVKDHSVHSINLRIFAFILIAIFSVGIAGCGASPNLSAVNQDVVQHDPRGFDNVLNGSNGAEAVVEGFIDSKGGCFRIQTDPPALCTINVVGSSEENKWIVIRLLICSENVTKNCIAERVRGQDLRRHYVFVIDDNSQAIDFDGCEVIEEPNTWRCGDSKQLRFTGAITVTNGRGELREPIKKINLR